jgi:hypothetical protein
VYDREMGSDITKAAASPDRPDSIGHPPRQVPVIITTNFDRALEKAFESIGQSYHVMYPVWRSVPHYNSREFEETRAAQGVTEWVLRTVIAAPDDRSSAPTPNGGGLRPLVILSGSYPMFPPPGVKLVGPVVLKLHGSPQEGPQDPSLRIPVRFHASAQSVIEANWALNHLLVLSERVYLETLMGDHGTSMPEWVQSQFHQIGGAQIQGAVFFLGYSISDWNVRMQMVRQSAHLPHEKSQGGRSIPPQSELLQRWAIVNSYDHYRTAILAHLNVLVCDKDLNEFGQRLNEAVLDAEEKEADLKGSQTS